MNKMADRFYGSVPGGLFNLTHERDLEAEHAMHAALRRDGKHLPAEHAARLASFDAIVSRGPQQQLQGLGVIRKGVLVTFLSCSPPCQLQTSYY